MAWALVEALGTNASKSSSTTLAVTTSGAAAVGNQVIVFVGGLTQITDIASCADSRGNSYTRLGGVSYDLGTGRLAAFISTLTTALQVGDTITATWASAVSTRIMCASEWSGGSVTLTGGTPTTAENAASTTMTVGPNASNVAIDDLVIAFFMSSNATDIWAPVADTVGGWTDGQAPSTGSVGTNRSGFEEWRIATSATTFTATATQLGSRSNDGIMVALAPTAVGPTEKAFSDSAAGAETLAEAVSLSIVDSAVGAETLTEAAALAVIDSAAGTEAFVPAAAASFTDGAAGVEGFVATPDPVPDLGGGGDAWAGRAERPYARLEAPPKPKAPVPSAPRRRFRATELVRPTPARSPVRLSEPRFPELRPPIALREPEFVAVAFEDAASGQERFGVLASESFVPPPVPWAQQVEELEMLALL